MNDGLSIRDRAARGWWPVLALVILAVEVSPGSGQIFTSWPIERAKRFPGCYVEFGIPTRGGPDSCHFFRDFPSNERPRPLPMGNCAGLKPGESRRVEGTGGRVERGGWVPLRRIIYPEGHPVCKRMTGEPHAVTFDGARYDLQAAGEFVGVRSMDDDLEVQYRLEGRGRPPRVSATTAVAARVGGRRVVLTAGRDPRVRVDGEPVELPEGRLMYLTEQEDAALVREYERYTIIWPDRSNLHVDVHSSYLNTYFLAPPGRDGRLVGLFGDGDGNPANDFRTRDDRLLPSPPPFSALYGEFAESWRVRPGESLFDYGPGESTDTFTDRSVPAGPAAVDDLSPADRARAEAACRDAGVTEPEPFDECVFDVGHTGDEGFVASALSQQVPPALSSSPTATVYSTGQGGEFRFPMGDRSFADRVVRHEPGAPAPDPRHFASDPTHALGPPDYRGVSHPSYASLGRGGSLVVAFTDNVLVDVPGPDLVIFEVGPALEAVHVAISEDGDTFVDVGTVRGREAALDIGPVSRPGARYSHVRVSDVTPRGREGYGGTPGPDIDAIGAIGAESR